jgi:hypothetical protein
MARAALKQFDRNGNGTIEGAELDGCPALKKALAVFDKNGDRAISADELAERFRAYKAAGIGAVGVSCLVRLNGHPIEKAVVRFVPEDCMNGATTSGTGTSDADGVAVIAGDDGTPGLPYGLYRITVSLTANGGSEVIPARYNTSTTLGREIGPDPRGVSTIELDLKSP